MTEKIAVVGLKEFSRALNKLDSDKAKLIRTANNEAADFLISKTKPIIPVRSGRARDSLKVRSTRVSARISVGGKKAPYYPWLDFGGATGRQKSVIRPFYKEGRYVYPTLSKYRSEIAVIQKDALADVARQAGLDVS